MKLIITEKPSVARDIANVLGVSEKKDGYIQGDNLIVTWALGHLIEFVNPDEYGDEFQPWRMDRLPIIPEPFRTKPIQQSKNQYQIVLQLLQRPDLKRVICATDAGREGELIFRLIYEDSKCTVGIERLWISSQTDKAIKEGFNQLKPGSEYNGLYDSARCRAEADWIVGINATRAYSIKFSRGRGVMSVGRVQTPVLKMIVDRYRAHTQFDSRPFYEIFIQVAHENGGFQLKWSKNDTDRFNSETDAKKVADAIQAVSTAMIQSVTKKNVIEKQPLLYDLTELQKDANKQFKFSADYTLKLMQELYERYKILSYPRTSSRYLSTDIAPKCRDLLQNIAHIDTVSPAITHIQKNNRQIAKRMIDDKKVTDHHAIIPTDKKPSIASMSNDHRQLYLMVIRRFVAAFFPECKKNHTEIIAIAAKETFKSTGTVMDVPGWRDVYALGDGLKKDTDGQLPSVNKGDIVDIKKVIKKTGKTKAPPLFTEASILAAMETAGKHVENDDMRQAMKDCGLGTPATRAQILEKLIHVKYITREKNKLIPTQKGEYIIDCILSEALLSPELTGQWEKKLNDIATSKKSRGAYMKEIKEFTKEVVQAVSDDTSYTIRADQTVYGNCPVCKKGTIIQTQKAYSCSRWKSDGCSFAIWKEMAQKTITEAQVKMLLTSGKTNVIKGFKNKDGKPFDAAIKLTDGNVGFDFQQDTLGSCPVCEKGRVIETAKAFSCDQWRVSGCKFVLWKEIASRKISKKEAMAFIKHKVLNDIEGFKRRSGEPFTASLMLTPEGKAQFKPRNNSSSN